MYELSPPLFWLLVALLVALLYFAVLLADNILQKGIGPASKFWRENIADDIPFPDECFDCKKSDCYGCEILNRCNGV